MMRYKLTAFLLLFLLPISILFLAPNIKGKDISEKYKEWLRQTSYTVPPQEKDVATSYATHFLNYKGLLSTDYLTNYIESITEVALILDPIRNINFLHFSISPTSISVDYNEPEDQYFCNFKLHVILKKDTEVIYQYTKDFPFYYYPDEADKVVGNGISIQDFFPVIDGNYRLNILIQNSVGKEFSVFEKDISVPTNPGPAKITGPVLGIKLQESPTYLFVPFKVLDTKLLVDPNNIFSSTDKIVVFFNLKNVTKDLWQEGKVEILINDPNDKIPSYKFFNVDLRDYPYNEIFSVVYSIRLEGLRPDYYKMKINLIDGKQEIIDEESTDFIVSPEKIVSHPFILAKSISPYNSYLYYYSLAHQYDKVNDLEKAEATYKKAYTLKPEYKAGLAQYACFLRRIKKYNESLELIESIKEDEKYKFDYFMIRGNIYMEMGNYPEAIDNLLEANKIYNSEVNLLNSLGFCFYKTNQPKKALDALRASLSLNSEQEDIRELIREIEKSRD